MLDIGGFKIKKDVDISDESEIGHRVMAVSYSDDWFVVYLKYTLQFLMKSCIFINLARPSSLKQVCVLHMLIFQFDMMQHSNNILIIL